MLRPLTHIELSLVRGHPIRQPVSRFRLIVLYYRLYRTHELSIIRSLRYAITYAH